LLVAICDATRPTTQQLGCELIRERYRAEDGWLYLARLSEHPSERLQLFASNLLDELVGGRPERLATLEPYFGAVLARPNRGRVAKERVLDLLEREALADAAAAAVVAPLLARFSGTAAIGDKGRAIAAMLRLRERWPELPLPLEVVPPEVRPGPREVRRGA